jgi:predicted DNA-binding transcriptional regulator AlpA
MSRAQRSKTQTAAGAKSQLDLFSVSLNVDAETAKPIPSRRAIANEVTQTALSSASPVSTTEAATTVDQRLRDFVMGTQRRRGRPPKLLDPDRQKAADERRLLDVREAAIRLGLSKSTLDKMRCSGRGPRFIRATDRAIRYDPEDLRAFADQRRLRSTSQIIEALNA